MGRRFGFVKSAGFIVSATALVSACQSTPPTGHVAPEKTKKTSGRIFVGDDGHGRPDNGATPQVVALNIMGCPNPQQQTQGCTGWLSSSNTITTAAHCLHSGNDPTQICTGPIQVFAINATGAARQSLANLTNPTVIMHPTWRQAGNVPVEDHCYGQDMAILVYPGVSIPRTIIRPLPILPSRASEPECPDHDEFCIMIVGAGNTADDCNPANGTFASVVNQLDVESGLGDGHCNVDPDSLYGEYDMDDSHTCVGDSGAPIIWKATGEVMAMQRGHGGDRVPGAEPDDSVGPVLWTFPSDPHGGNFFFWPLAADQDNDGIQAGYDNCDQIPNDQADFNGNGQGDDCEDSDGDGLLDADEIKIHGTGPGVADTDGDGLSDGFEVNTSKTNPKKVDTDDDGLTDWEEVGLGTNPLNADTDGDGLSDGAEVKDRSPGTDPLKPDTDGDGLLDGAEVLMFLTDRLKPDTDGDTLTDGQEVNTYRTNPLLRDTDADLLEDGLEVVSGTDPLNPDSDGDGVPDGRDTEFVEFAIERLPDSSFRPSKKPVFNHLAQAERFVQRGDIAGALARLGDLRLHVDGCGTAADDDDWVITCPEQLTVRTLVDLLISNLNK